MEKFPTGEAEGEARIELITHKLAHGHINTWPAEGGGYEIAIKLGPEEMNIPLGVVDEATARAAHERAVSLIEGNPGGEMAAHSSLLQVARVVEKEFGRKAA